MIKFFFRRQVGRLQKDGTDTAGHTIEAAILLGDRRQEFLDGPILRGVDGPCDGARLLGDLLKSLTLSGGGFRLDDATFTITVDWTGPSQVLPEASQMRTG